MKSYRWAPYVESYQYFPVVIVEVVSLNWMKKDWLKVSGQIGGGTVHTPTDRKETTVNTNANVLDIKIKINVLKVTF